MPRFTYRDAGIYREQTTGSLFHRPTINGRRTWRKLKSTTLTMARKEIAALKTRQLESDLGIAIDPYAAKLAIGELAKAWIAAGCPDRMGRPRAGHSLAAETGKLNRLLPLWSNRSARKFITWEDCQDYHAWRVSRATSERFRLNRSTDAELTTLNTLFKWAVQHPRKTGLRQNPLLPNRPRFDWKDDVRHCTAVMPMTDEIVHQHAAYLFSSVSSQALGWQLLLECLTGARTSEMLACRLDASQPRQPGYQDASALHLHRCKQGIEPWALLQAVPAGRGRKELAPLRDCLAAFRAWHRERYPKKPSPWFIPGKNPSQPMDRLALTNALARSSALLELPKITSHGCRAYFVLVLRSQGIDDSEIAKRLGHRGGVGEVEKTYGISEPGWFGARKLDFLPDKFEPAWSRWLPRDPKVIQLSIYQKYTTPRKTGSTGMKPSNSAARLQSPVVVG